MSELMKGLGDIQRSGQLREEEANNARKEAELKAVELERKLEKIQGQFSLLTQEKTMMADSFDNIKNENVEKQEQIKVFKEEIENLKLDVNNQSNQLQLEKELRIRADEKEREERTERIALSAQMVAMTKDHAHVEAQLKEANDALERKWRDKMEEEGKRYEQKEKELSDSKETVAGLEGELESLRQMLNDKKSLADAKNAEEISRLKGEINILKERLEVEKQRAYSAGVVSAEQLVKLQEEIRKGQSERRR